MTSISTLLERLQIDTNKKHVLWLAAASTVVVAVPLWTLSRNKRHKTRTTTALQRSWSFTSEGMRIGVFPPSVDAPDTITNAALYFESSNTLPSVEDLIEHLVKPLLQYDRFKLIPSNGGLRRSQTGYKPEDLVRTITITGDDSLLHETLYPLLSEKLDARGRNEYLKELPFWELIRIENLGTPTNPESTSRSVVLFRAHHCLGDGLSLVSVFDKLLTKEDGSPMESRVTKALLTKKTNTIKPSLSSILSAVVHVLTLGQSRYDDPTVFYQQRAQQKLQYNPQRKIVLLPTVPLDFIKALRKAAPLPGTTINDLLMCAVSQAIHDYCKASKDDTLADKRHDLQCRALLPVSLPRSSKPSSANSNNENDYYSTALRNQFCMVSADLSVGYTTLRQRLEQIHQTTTFLKTSPRAFVQLWIQNNIVNRLPISVGQQTAHDIFSRHSLVLTNVPGPEHICHLAGRAVTGLQLFFPNVIPQVDLMSYAGQVYGNIIYDPNHLDDGNSDGGESLASYYAQALVQLGMEFNVEVPKVLTDAAACDDVQLLDAMEQGPN